MKIIQSIKELPFEWFRLIVIKKEEAIKISGETYYLEDGYRLYVKDEYDRQH